MLDNNYIYIGDIVKTHGIKGEIKILSNFEYKDKVFIPENQIYIGNNLTMETITSYRHHQNYDMITLKGYSNINDILKYLKEKVYIKKEDLKLTNNEILLEDYLNLTVIYNNEPIGKVIDIKNITLKKRLLVVQYKVKEIYVPFELINKIDLINKCLYINYLEGLF